MSCNHLSDCLRCGAIFDDMEDRAEKAEAEKTECDRLLQRALKELADEQKLREKAEAELARLKERNRKFLDKIRENLPNPHGRYDTVEYADMLHKIDKIYDEETVAEE